MSIGAFSVSLTVKDIKASQTFYKNLASLFLAEKLSKTG
jgi:predicted lactoylglutathione lyase